MSLDKRSSSTTMDHINFIQLYLYFLSVVKNVQRRCLPISAPMFSCWAVLLNVTTSRIALQKCILQIWTNVCMCVLMSSSSIPFFFFKHTRIVSFILYYYNLLDFSGEIIEVQCSQRTGWEGRSFISFSISFIVATCLILGGAPCFPFVSIHLAQLSFLW